jgi:hypothetical protein
MIPSEQVAALITMAIRMAMVPLGAVIMLGVAWVILRNVSRQVQRRVEQSLSTGPDWNQRFDDLQVAVEAIALEVERIGEIERFAVQRIARREPAVSSAFTADRAGADNIDEVEPK